MFDIAAIWREQMATDVRAVSIPRCGHLPQEELPEEFAGLVAGFCKTKAVTSDR